MTVHVAVSPLEVRAVIVAVPADTPVTVPLETVATEELLVDHVTVLFVAFDGDTVAVKANPFPT